MAERYALGYDVGTGGCKAVLATLDGVNAASEFEWAAELQPDWPYPWFGLGLAEASAPLVSVSTFAPPASVWPVLAK